MGLSGSLVHGEMISDETKRAQNLDHPYRQLAPVSEMQELLRLREGQYELDQATFNASTHQAVADVVQRQIATGLDVILDQVGGCGTPQPTCSGPEEATPGRPSRPAR